MRFRFRLETLLRVRKRLEEVAEMEFSAALSRQKAIEGELEENMKALRREENKLREKMEEGIMATDFNLRCQLISQMEQKCRELDKRLKQARLDVAQARGQLRQRHMDTELVSGLKERDLKRYLKEVDARLQKELDDLVSLGRARQMKSSGGNG